MKSQVCVVACLMLFASAGGVLLIGCCHNADRDRAWVDVGLHDDIVPQLAGGRVEEFSRWESQLERTPRLSEAWSQLHVANEHWRARRQAEAFSLWRRTASDYADTDAAYAALTNLGNALQAQDDTLGAIAAFESIVDMPPPALCGKHGYDNYRHDACRDLSELYEERGNLRLALRYAEQAAEQDRFSDWCGFNVGWVEMALEQRVKALRAKMAQ